MKPWCCSKVFLTAGLVVSATSCGGLQVDLKPQVSPPVQSVVLDTSAGPVSIDVFPGKAPRNSENFLELCENGAFDNTYFHRVALGYLVQGGDPNTRDEDRGNDGQGGTLIAGFSEALPQEPSDLKHVRGAVASVGSGGASQSQSQFFVLLRDDPALDGRFSVFGMVTAGIEALEEIAKQPGDPYPDHGGVNPATPQLLKKCTVTRTVTEGAPSRETP